MFKIFGMQIGSLPKGPAFAKLQLTMTPIDRQLGQHALNREITQEQWRDIQAVLRGDLVDSRFGMGSTGDKQGAQGDA